MDGYISWEMNPHESSIWEPVADYDNVEEDAGKGGGDKMKEYKVTKYKPDPLQTIGDIYFAEREYNSKTFAEYSQDKRYHDAYNGYVDPNIYHQDEDADGNPKTFKRVLVRFAERTSMQGVPYIYVSSVWYAKLAWTLLFVVGFGMMVAHLYLLFDEFYQYDTHSTVSLGFSILSFPGVTICNVNPIKHSKMNLASAELRALVESVSPDRIAGSMEAERTKFEEMGITTGQLPGQLSPTGSAGGQPTNTGENQAQPTDADSDQPPTSSEGESQAKSSEEGEGQTPPSEEGQGQPPLSDEGQGQPTPSDEGQGQATPPKTTGVPGDEGSNTGQEFPRERRSVSVNQEEKPLRRSKRFIEGFQFEESNTRYKQDDTDIEDSVTFSGNKSTNRAIEDEFRFLYSTMNRDSRQEMGHTIDEMLMECTFRGITCTADQFRLVQTAQYGNCYTIENNKFVSTVGGPDDGLVLYMFTQDAEYIHGITNSLGFQVHIHNQGAFPDPYAEGLSVPAGAETFIGLKKVYIERLKDPYGDCIDNNDFYNDYGIVYTQKICQKFCLQTSITEVCDCYDAENEEIYKIIYRAENAGINQTHYPCRSESESTCLNHVTREFQDGELDCDCPSPCSENVYTKSISSKIWPTTEYATVLVEYLCSTVNQTECQAYKEKSRSEIALSFLKIVIYFEDLNYENITEKVDYETFQFVSDVGGTIGLWIGLSMISFFEVVQFLYEMAHYVFYMKPKLAREKARKTKQRQQKHAAVHALRFMSQKNLGGLSPPTTGKLLHSPSESTKSESCGSVTTSSTPVKCDKPKYKTDGEHDLGAKGDNHRQLAKSSSATEEFASLCSDENEARRLLQDESPTTLKERPPWYSTGSAIINPGFSNEPLFGLRGLGLVPKSSPPAYHTAFDSRTDNSDKC